jgi:glycosyltransferase involved in cell wall biosynthesis
MRIGIFTDWCTPAIGGTESAITYHCEMITRCGGTVHVFAPTRPGAYDSGDGLVVRIPSIPTLFGQNNARAMFIHPGLVRSLRRFKFDIVHSETPLSAGILADMVARDQDVPHVHTIHGILPAQVPYYPAVSVAIVPAFAALARGYLTLTNRRDMRSNTSGGGESLLVRSAWRSMLSFANLANAVTVPSRHVAERLTDLGLRHTPIIVPNAVHTATYRGERVDRGQSCAPRSSVRIAYVGRVVPEKRSTSLIRAVARIPADIDWQLVVAGDGASLGRCRKLAVQLGVAGRVRFTGPITRSQVARLLSVSDIFVLCSHGFDNHPMSLLEAISAGLPVVYCDASLTEGLSPANALCADESPEGLAQAMALLLRDGELRQSMSEEALLQSRRFDVEVVRHELWAVYTSLRTTGSRSVAGLSEGSNGLSGGGNLYGG